MGQARYVYEKYLITFIIVLNYLIILEICRDFTYINDVCKILFKLIL